VAGASSRARRVLAALYRIGWRLKRETGSHKTLSREGWADFVFAFHDADENRPADARPHRETHRPDA
jgi:predicted RNA binding protein YcfA (HicA-like mRNA interferase family)